MLNNLKLSRNTWFWTLISLLTILVSCQLYLTTTWGAGLSPDSIAYIKGAKSILKNWNLTGTGTHFPPLYPVLIALTSLITGDILTALRLLQITITALNFILITLIVWKATNKALLPTILCSLLFVTSQSVLYVHTMAWSEGLFCCFTLLGFYFLALYFEHEGRRFPALTFSAVSIALAFLTRYVGITLVITGCITLIIYADGKKLKRTATALYFGFISSLPMLLWMGHNWLSHNTATDRTIVFHAVSLTRIKIGIHVFLNWLYLPQEYPFILLIMLVLVATFHFIYSKDTKTDQSNKTFEIFSIFILIYISFLLIAITLFDAHIPLKVRILFPVYLAFIPGLLVILGHRIKQTKSIRLVSYPVFFALFLLAFAQIGLQQEYLSYASTNGIQFASKRWIQSEMLQWLKKLPQDTIIYTNGPDAVYIIANRPSKMIPRVISPGDRTENKHFVNEIKEMAAQVSNGKGVVIYFDIITWRWYLPTIKQLSQILPLQLKYRCRDGIAVGIRSLAANSLTNKNKRSAN